MSDDAIASPLNLLSEEDEAREVLLLSFTLNLEFWERYALSVARGLGARVTVVGDAAMTQGEPGQVRYAGITYLDGRAACRSGGAFHPKLLVIASDDYATVAIGSGNATLSGWHANAELWTVLAVIAPAHRTRSSPSRPGFARSPGPSVSAAVSRMRSSGSLTYSSGFPRPTRDREC